MAELTVNFPDGLYRELDDQIGASERFTTKNEAVRYYVRQGLQRDMRFSDE